MKKRTVTQYICEFCNKRGLSASHMGKHERHCTLNPNRICRVCPLLSDGQTTDFYPAPLSELVSMLPIPSTQKDEWGCVSFPPDFYTELKDALPRLEEKTGGCPACMMAALRQRKIPLPVVEGFSFSDRMKKVWDDINHANMQKEYAAY